MVNSSQGGGSKDTWVLRETPEQRNVVADRGFAVLAGALYGARRRHGAHSRRELPHAAGAVGRPVPAALGPADRHGGRAGALLRSSTSEANAQTVYEFLAFRADNPNSIVQCITKARENARTIRDRISREMWEDINGLYHSVTRFDPAEQMSSGPHRFCDAVKFGSHRFFGVTDATLPHDEGWDFLKIGWSLERAEMTARLVDLQFQSLLETPSSWARPTIISGWRC